MTAAAPALHSQRPRQLPTSCCRRQYLEWTGCCPNSLPHRRDLVMGGCFTITLIVCKEIGIKWQ